MNLSITQWIEVILRRNRRRYSFIGMNEHGCEGFDEVSLDMEWESGLFCLKEGGEVHEMDVPSCYSLFDLWIVATVLSKT